MPTHAHPHKLTAPLHYTAHRAPHVNSSQNYYAYDDLVGTVAFYYSGYLHHDHGHTLKTTDDVRKDSQQSINCGPSMDGYPAEVFGCNRMYALRPINILVKYN